MNVETVYQRCQYEGNIVLKENIDINKAQSILDSIENELKIIEHIKKLKLNTASHLFKTYYDILREIIDAFLIFNKIQSSNHICLFNYIVIKHPELKLSWEKLDQIRRIRNKICYYGQTIPETEWKKYEIIFEKYILKLKKEVQDKIKNYK